VETIFLAGFSVFNAKNTPKTFLIRLKTFYMFLMLENRVLWRNIAFFEQRLCVRVVSNKFKSEVSIQKCIHLRYRSRGSFEAERKRSSMAKRGFK